MGRNARSEEFQFHWTQLDTARHDLTLHRALLSSAVRTRFQCRFWPNIKAVHGEVVGKNSAQGWGPCFFSPRLS